MKITVDAEQIHPKQKDYLIAIFDEKTKKHLAKLFKITNSEEIYEILINKSGILAFYKYKDETEINNGVVYEDVKEIGRTG